MKKNKWQQISIILLVPAKVFVLLSALYLLLTPPGIELLMGLSPELFSQELKEIEGIQVKEGIQVEESIQAEEGIVTIDFKNADIRNVLRILAQKSGVNIIAGEDIQGMVTIRLVDVPWERALNVILRIHGFVYERDEDIIMVTTLEKLVERRKVQQEAVEKESLDIQAFTLNFSRVEEMKVTIEKLISGRGRIALDRRTNTLIITDTESNLIKISQMIERLDKTTPQVMIEAKIIETRLTDDERLGIDWEMKIAASGARRPITIPFEADRGLGDFFPAPAPGVHFPLPEAADFVFGTLNFSELRVVLEMLNERTDTSLISNPRITALNNQEARIIVGTIVPIPIFEISRETGMRVIVGYDEQEIGIKLTVTPNINEENYVILHVKPSVDEIVGWTGPDDERPIISTRSAETKVMIRDGETLVIGGLISEKTIQMRRKVPILGNLPILGRLFSKTIDTVEKTDLLIFITPHIIVSEEVRLSPEEIPSS